MQCDYDKVLILEGRTYVKHIYIYIYIVPQGELQHPIRRQYTHTYIFIRIYANRIIIKALPLTSYFPVLVPSCYNMTTYNLVSPN